MIWSKKECIHSLKHCSYAILVLISVIWQLNYQGQLFVISRRLYPTVLTVKTHRTDSEDHVWLIRGNVSKSIELWGDTKHTTRLHQLPARAPFTLQATLRDKATQSHSFQWRAGDFRRHKRPDETCPATWQSSESFNFMQMKSDFRERQPIGTKWAHVIILLSAVDKQTQWKKSRLYFPFTFVCMYGLNSYLYYIEYFASMFVCSSNKLNLPLRQLAARTPTSDLITSPWRHAATKSTKCERS